MNCLFNFYFLKQPSVENHSQRLRKNAELRSSLSTSGNDTLVVPGVQITRFQDGIRTQRIMSGMQSIGYEMR
jgi:hypothetical protein